MMTQDPIELSEREREILRLVATGASNKEIAQQLVISPNTVKVHLRNIFSKIGVASRTEAAMYAVRNQLVAESGSMNLPQSPIAPAENLIPISQTLPDVGVSAEPGFEQEHGSSKKTTAKILTGSLVVAFLIIITVISLIFLPELIQPEINPTLSTSIIDANERWRQASAMSLARQFPAAAAYEGAIYVIGGENQHGVTGSVERFDPNTDQWSTLAAKPLPVSEVQAAILEDKIFVPGGKSTDREILSRVEIYDPGSNTWESGAELPVPLSGYSLVTFEGKIYLFGGWDGQNYRSEVYEYTPEENRWKYRIEMDAPRAFAGSVAIGNHIYIAGGTDGQKAYSDVLVYRPNQGENGEWGESVEMLTDRYLGSVITIAETIYFLGGKTYLGEPLPYWQFNPQLKGWYTIETPDLEGWSSFAAVPLQNMIYVLGGQLDEMPTADVWTFQALYTVAIPVVR